MSPSKAHEVERSIIRSQQSHEEPAHIWRRTLYVNGHEIRQTYNLALCEERMVARAHERARDWQPGRAA